MKKTHKLILLAILISGFGLRFFKLPQLSYFSMDEAIVAFRSWGLFVLKRPFLIGGGSPLQIHLPPYFYYLSAVLLAPFKFNPIGWGVWAAVFSLATIYLTYYLANKLYNHKVGLLAGLFYALLFTPVFFDRHYWPLFFNPLLTLLTLILLNQLKTKKLWPYLGLAGVMVLTLTADPSNIPLILAVIAFYLIKKKKLNLKFTRLSILSAVGVFLGPLLLFDLRHNWQNLKGITRLFHNTLSRQTSLDKIIDSLLLLPRSLVRFWYSPQTSIAQLHGYCYPDALARQRQLPIILVFLAIGLLTWFISRYYRSGKALLKTISLLLIFYSAGIFLFALLGYSIFDHYLTGLLPVFAIITAVFLARLPKTLAYLGTGLLITFNIYQISQAHNPYGLAQKQALVIWASQQLNGQPYILDSISKCQRENGLRYLFELTDNPPVISFMDSNFFWLYRQPPATSSPDKVLLVTDKPLQSQLPILSNKTFGAINAYILDNSSLTYEIKIP